MENSIGYVDNNKLQEVIDKLSELEIKSKSKSEYLLDTKRVPRVTEILSAMIAEPGLMNWANNLGWKRISYKQFMKEAADKGTYTHLAIERFLKGKDVNISTFGIMNYKIQESVESAFDAFKFWWDVIHTNHTNIELVLSEETLMCPYFGGTCDCVLKVDNEYWLVDFKTSNHMNYNYTLQLAAYRYLLKTVKDINVSKCMVLKLSKNFEGYKTYELNMNEEEHLDFIEKCTQTFIILSTAYRMRLDTTDIYEMIFKN